MRSRGEAFDALRLTITRADGVEAAKLVWVDDARRAALAPIIESAVCAAREHVASDPEARDLLLGLLAEGDLVTELRDLRVGSDARADRSPDRINATKRTKGA
jgi:hypothetical protein